MREKLKKGHLITNKKVRKDGKESRQSTEEKDPDGVRKDCRNETGTFYGLGLLLRKSQEDETTSGDRKFIYQDPGGVEVRRNGFFK